jgi:hypothetical protein
MATTKLPKLTKYKPSKMGGSTFSTNPTVHMAQLPLDGGSLLPDYDTGVRLPRKRAPRKKGGLTTPSLDFGEK